MTTHGTVFFDNGGEVIRVIARSRVTETYTNSVTGKTLVNHGVFQDTFTRIGDTDEFRHVVVGYGLQGNSARSGACAGRHRPEGVRRRR